MKAKISDHLTYKVMLKLTIMPIIMMVFSSLYTIVDGFCVSFFCNPDSFAGLNLIFPAIMIIGGTGFIFGTGGSALCAKYLGEGNKQKANEVFSMLIVVTIVVGIIISLLGFILIEPIAYGMASVSIDSNQNMIDEAIKYGRALALGQVLFMLQSVFQSFFLVAEKPQTGFKFTLAAGITNIILDVLFIGLFDWGVVGAAAATILGMAVSGIGPIIYFKKYKDGRIGFTKFTVDWNDLVKTCTNGVSEFINNVSSSIVGVIFNLQLLRYYGQIGISAYGALMYIAMIFVMVFVGFSIGIAPAVSYQYGAKNSKELSTILKRSIFVIAVLSLMMFIISEILSTPLSLIFSSGNDDISSLTKEAIMIYSFTFLTMGFGIFSSSFFTALNNGFISGLISFFRCLVFQISTVYILPVLMGSTGIWWSICIAEFGSFILSLLFLISKNKKYNYFEKVSLFE